MLFSSSVDYYSILGITSNASNEAIKEAYKKKSLTTHPDRAAKNNLTVEKATEEFKRVNEAYEVLSDSFRRRLYDASRVQKIPNPTSFAPFDENFFANMRSTGSYSGKAKEEKFQKYDNAPTCCPSSISEGIKEIIDSDDSVKLNAFLKINNPKNSILHTILYKACKSGMFNIVKYLIESTKLNPHLKIQDGLSFTGPIFKAAAQSGHLEMVKYLLETCLCDIESKGLSAGTQDTALSRAAAAGREAVVKYLVSKGANLNPEVSNSDILNGVIKSGHLSILIFLLEAGTKIGRVNLFYALTSGTLEITKYLLLKKPGIQSHCLINNTPACLAVGSGNIALVKFLEENEGVDLFEKSRFSNDSIPSLLSSAASSGCIEMMEFLLDERGLNEKIASNSSYILAMLHAAIESKKSVEMLRFLMEERKFLLASDQLKALIVESGRFAGIEKNSYVQSYLQDTWKDVLLAIANGGLEAVSLANLFRLYNRKIIREGKYHHFEREIHANIKRRNLSMQQLRDFFIENKEAMEEALFYYSSYYYQNDLSPLKLLVDLGVDLNAENSEGIAAIHVAYASGGSNQIFKFFLENDVDLSKKNKNGESMKNILEIQESLKSKTCFYGYSFG